jgi:pimeloyl-ACP methyl ester carboxylesterase
MNPSNQIALPDCRELSFAEFGSPDGLPVMYFHGSPSSRLEPSMVGDETWEKHELRIIAPDRPGIGSSDFQPDRGFSDWPNDVVHLADHLGLGSFAVLGNSGGGPYVSVCAAKIPERITSAAIVSGGWRMDLPEAKNGMPFPNRLFLFFAAHASPLVRLMLKAMGGSEMGDRDKELEKMRSRVTTEDFAAFSKPGRIEALHETMQECIRNSTTGAAYDLKMYMRDFDFAFSEINIPITLFHGEKDVNAPIALIRRMVNEIPTANLITFENDAHFSTLCNHIGEIAHILRRPTSRS